MKLIMRADDLGFSDGVNCGILKSVKDGLITSVGLMPNMQEAKNGYEMIKDYRVCLGQHTNICVGRPLADPKLIPSLVQENGAFCSSQEIRQRTNDTIVMEEAEIEIEAQLKRFRAITGKNPDYFEGHAIFQRNSFKRWKMLLKDRGCFTAIRSIRSGPRNMALHVLLFIIWMKTVYTISRSIFLKMRQKYWISNVQSLSSIQVTSINIYWTIQAIQSSDQWKQHSFVQKN